MVEIISQYIYGGIVTNITVNIMSLSVRNLVSSFQIE